MTHLKTLALALTLVPGIALAQAAKPGSHFLENWDLDDNGAITLEEITTRRADVFYMFDVDANDALDAQEYVLFDETRAADMQNAGEAAGKGAHKIQTGLTLAFNDVDADGQVSKDEFIARSPDWFATIDRDADGVITTADFGPKG